MFATPPLRPSYRRRTGDIKLHIDANTGGGREQIPTAPPCSYVPSGLVCAYLGISKLIFSGLGVCILSVFCQSSPSHHLHVRALTTVHRRLGLGVFYRLFSPAIPVKIVLSIQSCMSHYMGKVGQSEKLLPVARSSFCTPNLLRTFSFLILSLQPIFVIFLNTRIQWKASMFQLHTAQGLKLSKRCLLPNNCY